MELFQYFIFILVIFAAISKALVMKPCANIYDAGHITLFFSFWLFITNSLLIPYHYETLVNDLINNTTNLSFAFLKGLFFYGYMVYGNKLTKSSGSSRSFIPVIGVGIIAIFNFFLFGEILTQYQLISAILITLWGVFYYFKGHLNETNSQHIFLIFLFFAVILSVFDHLGNSNLHWFTYLYFSILIMLIISFFYTKKSIESYKFIFTEKRLILAAAIYIAYEIFITSIRVNILPVTVINIAGLMSTPLIMLIMQGLYKESTIKKQLFFGLGAFFIGLIALI